MSERLGFGRVTDSTAVILTSGVEAHRALVASTMLVLQGWLNSPLPGPLLVYDVAMMARSPGYKPFGRNGLAISEAGFMDGDSGKLHRSIAEIIACAVVGDGMSMQIVNPIKAA